MSTSEADEPKIVDRRAAHRRFPMAKPDGAVPAVQRYSARFHDGPHEMMVLTLGAQLGPGHTDSIGAPAALGRFAETIGGLADADAGPMTVDHARYVDGADYPTHVAVAYWADRSRFEDWWASEPVSSWWNHEDRLTGELGYFVEPAPVRSDALETITFQEYVVGLSACPISTVTAMGESGYWGAARDRIERSGWDRFDSPPAATLDHRTPTALTQGCRVRVVPNVNHCLIRSGVSWEACGPIQLSSYEDNVLPRLNAGMEYLRTNAAESGCWSVRQVEVVDETGSPVGQSWVGAHFLSLRHLEEWAHQHPTHLAIYGQAQKERIKYQDDLELRTYHEVHVIESPMPFEYLNCHPATGGLSHLPRAAE